MSSLDKIIKLAGMNPRRQLRDPVTKRFIDMPDLPGSKNPKGLQRPVHDIHTEARSPANIKSRLKGRPTGLPKTFPNPVVAYYDRGGR